MPVFKITIECGMDKTAKLRGKEKLRKIPVKIEPTTNALPKPDWIRVKIPTGEGIDKVKDLLQQNRLNTVCEEASCPNLPECFSHGTATFMIMGDRCTRRCSFCDVAHGRPDPLDEEEPARVADAVKRMQLRYVVITSVDRDDLRDGGAEHFANCIRAIRSSTPDVKIEILVPDFRSRMDKALCALEQAPCDVFNHNIETVPRLYRQARSGADYEWSLTLLKAYKEKFPDTPTKSGIMLGLGETNNEVIQVLKDLRAHNVDMITIGQYLQPSAYHMPVDRYVPPEEFNNLAILSKKLGFKNVASGPMVRSSYHADKMAKGEMVS